MGYYENLAGLLEPLGIFRLDRNSLSGAELAALGGSMDPVQEWLDELAREQDLTTAEHYGLERYEELLPWRPVAETAPRRRAALMGLLGITDGWLTRERILAALPGCGAEVEVRETGDPLRLQVSFPRLRGVPEEMDRLAEIVEGILPCHLAVEYLFLYPSWLEVEQCVDSWDALEAAAADWNALERMAPV